MDAAIHRLITSIHQSPALGVVAVTGGGAGAVSALLGVPGASRTILEAVVPYHEHALVEFLGLRPESFCSEATAAAMALRAFERACWLAPGEAVFGLGCTASLATDRPKKGNHRLHLAVQLADRVSSYSLTLEKGARDRTGEESVLDAILINGLAEAAGVKERAAVPLLSSEQLQQAIGTASDPLLLLMQGDNSCICAESDGRLRLETPRPTLVVPGSFNPLHSGHFGMAAAAARLTGLPAAFELSVVNVDKPSLSNAEVRRRLNQFMMQAPLWLTRAPTFLEKARLFPRAIFAVGLDTAERILALRYYQGSDTQLLEALGEFRSLGCRFLVAGRAEQGRFRTLADLILPESFRSLFQAIPESEFRLDVCSTALRQSRA